MPVTFMNPETSSRVFKNKKVMVWFKNIGIIGWSITIPTLAGMAVGTWVSPLCNDWISLTPVLSICGFVAGFFYAWYWFSQQNKKQ